MATEKHNGFHEELLFDPTILKEMDFSNCCGTYNPAITPQNPGEHLILRPMNISDFDKGYLDLLTHLTLVGDISHEEFEERFHSLKACKSYYIVVLEDTNSGLVIGSATLAVEQKFIRQCASKGRIEDVVVSDDYRGQQLGKLLIDVLLLVAIKVGCYKTSLECKDPMVPFYSKFGLVKEEGQNYMCRRF